MKITVNVLRRLVEETIREMSSDIPPAPEGDPSLEEMLESAMIVGAGDPAATLEALDMYGFEGSEACELAEMLATAYNSDEGPVGQAVQQAIATIESWR